MKKNIYILFILSSVMENIINNEKNEDYKFLAKQQFSRSIKEIKKLNKLVNKSLEENLLDTFDDITNDIVEAIDEVLEKYGLPNAEN